MGMTIRKIAEAHRVSPATVSLVLNDKPGVREATRRRITEALVDNGYQIKKKIQKRRVQYICYQSSTWFAEQPDGFYAYMFEGLDLGCKRCNAALSVTYANRDNLQTLCNQAVADGSDGIIFLGTEYSHEAIPEFLDFNIPIVVVDNPFYESSVNCIYPDDHVGIEETVRELKNLGHRDIGFVTIRGTYGELYNREQIWRKVVRSNGLMINEENVLHLEPIMADAREQIRKYIRDTKQLPTALMNVNDVLAAAVITNLTSEGVRVPEDISVVGYDDSNLCEITSPNLSSIRSDVTRMGEMAVRRLMQLIENPGEPHIKILMETNLIRRGSIGPAFSK